ncbi:MAG TPA: LysE family translocator [Candidatus Sulfotelmatobacter sp.]|jgi:threonine/homoserine/homoserine lactone efflux protein|nr:LysE family translocator [Candidatus Sulfotelmatobacter sp.]
MSEMAALLGFSLVLALGAISPGPSFLMVARISVAKSRGDGLAAAFGMGIGGLVFGAAALLGLKTVLAAVPLLYAVLKVLGGAYLIYLGLRIWRSAKTPLAEDGASNAGRLEGRAFWLGLLTQLSNPKTAIVYASLIASCIPQTPSRLFSLSMMAAIFCIETGWYALVAVTLSSNRSKAVYLRLKGAIDRVCGAVLGFLGLRMAASGWDVVA